MKQNSKAARAEKGRGKRRIVALSYRFMRRGERYIPPVLRGLLGLLLVIGGVLGFLPILGFWMIPLGLALIATDIPPMRRWFNRRLHHSRRQDR